MISSREFPGFVLKFAGTNFKNFEGSPVIPDFRSGHESAGMVSLTVGDSFELPANDGFSSYRKVIELGARKRGEGRG